MTKPTGAPASRRVALLDVSRSDGWHVQHRLDLEGMVIVGSSDRCGLSLFGDDIASMHCSLRRDNVGVWLSDWQSRSGTFLDGVRVSEETQVQPGDTIQVGNYTIQLGFSELGSTDGTEPANTADCSAVSNAAAMSPAPEESLSRPAETRRSENLVETFPTPQQLPSLERKATEEAAKAIDMVPAEQSHEDMLRAEILQLQYELAERDAQLGELADSVATSDTRPDEASSDQLLGRIEELLDELDRNDARMATLEELLIAAEEANCAEREERRQLEAWVADIETLVSEHDKTRSVEVETLKQRVATLVAERDDLMQQLSRPASGKHSDQADAEDTEEVAKLRVQIAHLGQQLQAANATASRFEGELRLRDTQLTETKDAKRSLREEHLKLAEERAALARLRAEIAANQAELPTRPPDERTDVDSRVRVFRQHLREIHEEEKQEHKTRTLSARIAQLWNYVEQP